MFKIQFRFISFIVSLPPPKITANSTPNTNQNGDTHRIYGKSDIIVISNFLKLPLTFLDVAVFFLLEKQRLLNYKEKCLLNSFMHYCHFLKKPSHLTPGLGLCNILAKRQIRQFLGVRVQLYMPKSHLRVDIVFQNNIGNKGE